MTTEYRAGVEAKQAHPFATRVVDVERRIVEYVGSTEATDRYSTRLIGWTLKNFRNNPVFLWGHSYTDLPIGRVEEVRVNKDKQLVFRVQYAPRQIHPFAGTVFDLVAEGFINAVSVGFIPGKVEAGEDGITELRDNDLLELSQVPVPANPEALANAMSRGLLPEQHQDFFIVNKKAEVRELDGVDIEALAAQVREWVDESDTLNSDLTDTSASDDTTIGECSVCGEPKEATDGAVFALQPQLVTRDAELETVVSVLEARDAELEEAVDRVAELEARAIDDVTATGALILIGRAVDVTLDADDYQGFVDDVVSTYSRAGAVLSRANQESLQRARDGIQSVLDSALKPEDVEEDAAHGEHDKKKKKSVEEDDRFSQLERSIKQLTERVDESDHNAVAGELIGKRGASATLLDTALEVSGDWRSPTR